MALNFKINDVYVASWLFTGVAIFSVYVHHMKRVEGRMGQQTL
ncbi:MAG: hypothetical protein UDD43_01225 [Agathobacter sp.]|nr:hypothetical protein [Agathobacter sp.]